VRNILIVLLAFFFVNAFAQSPNPQPIKIFGKFINDSGKSVIPGIGVTLYTPDSTKQFFTVTDNNGIFMFQNVTPGRYRLRASFIGYQDFNIRLAYSTVNINMGVQKMKLGTIDMKAVTIHGIVPVQQREDTTEYNADAFKTQPDATAEDLVNKMPGITSQNGAVTVNGEQVTQVLVDGTPFW